MDTSSESPTPPADGVIKFELEYTAGSLPSGASCEPICRWFGICRALGLIGKDPERYEGAAYGNISQRAQRGFLVTGTQTGAKANLDNTDIAWVKAFDVASNHVVSEGPARPSSESLTHGQLYALDPTTNFIVHVHSPMIWQQARRLGLPMTASDAAYGTPEMAQEVERLMQQREAYPQGVFGMGGHEDGIVVFGETPEAAGLHLLRLYRQACELRS